MGRKPGVRVREWHQLLPTDMEKASFGTYFAKLRIRSGLSQSKLAEAVGICQGSVANVESMGVKIARDTLLKVAEVLNLNEYERDALLFKAGKQPVINWMMVWLKAQESEGSNE